MKQQIKTMARDILTQNILPYWIDKMTDPRGGFYGRRDGNDSLCPDAPKGAILNARILWTFSAAYRIVGDEKYLEMATRAKRQIIDLFYDKQYGGVFWAIDAQGKPVDDKKQFYALGFAIYGLSEYARATGDAEARDYALRLFRDIEDHSRDRSRGGYCEALTRDWQPIADMRLSDKDFNASKTMNTHLHIIEPYTNLLRILDPASAEYAAVYEATRSLLELFIDTFELPNGHLALFFDDDWHRLDANTSYGHDIECSWLMLETAQVLGDPQLLKRTLAAARRMADAALEGICPDGSLINERLADGTTPDEHDWWVQAECVVGLYYLHLFHGAEIQPVMKTLQYIVDNIIDHDNGEWHWGRRNGRLNTTDDKAGFWKCPYHNTRMCLELMK